MPPRAHRIQGDEHDGAMVFFRQPTGHDAYHPGVPTAFREHEGRVVGLVETLLDLLVRGKLHAPLQRLPAAVELVDILGQLQCAVGAIGHQQFHAQLRLGQPARRVQPRRQRKADVLAIQVRLAVPVDLGLDLGNLHQRGQPQRRAAGETLQAMMHQHAVFIDQRHDVGHGPQRRQSHRLDQEIPHSRADLLRPAGLLAKGPGDLRATPEPLSPLKG